MSNDRQESSNGILNEKHFKASTDCVHHAICKHCSAYVFCKQPGAEAYQLVSNINAPGLLTSWYWASWCKYNLSSGSMLVHDAGQVIDLASNAGQSQE